MNEIGEALNLGSISTYTARHSFATVLKRSGTNIAFISESLGHSSLEITQTYLDSFEDDALRKRMPRNCLISKS
ncbi:MAG: tyrosine-type recombinase/integrase [Bacteroidales bacterium]|nr:tyrosine-type recombinase/integrase [Bacteroidales bacterium]